MLEDLKNIETRPVSIDALSVKYNQTLGEMQHRIKKLEYDQQNELFGLFSDDERSYVYIAPSELEKMS